MRTIRRLLAVGAFLWLAPLAGQTATEDTIRYVDAADFPRLGQVTTEGLENPYDRLPAYLKDSIRAELWALGKNSAGIAVRFRTDSKKITARWEVLNNTWMNHMTPTGIKGLDLYAWDEGRWIFVGSGRPGYSKGTFTSTFISNMDGQMREYMLYLPLYDCATKVEIGVLGRARIERPELLSPVEEKPVVVYGTSITQGGCANRPGMAYTSILSRRMNREFINLGFSGNGRLDPEIARLMAQVDASCYVLDNMANCTTQMLDRLEEFVGILRQAHPDTPIVLLGNAHYTYVRFNTVSAGEVAEKDARLRELFRQMSREDKNLYYIPGERLIGLDDEATVDGTHFTDLGFVRMSDNLYPVLERILRRHAR